MDGILKKSPVFPFLDAIAGSIQNVAPERAEELERVLVDHEIRLVVDQDMERVFRARKREGRNEVVCSIYGAEIVWAAAFSSVSVHKHFKENAGRELKFADCPDTESLPELLHFAFDRRVTGRSVEPWPESLPAPRFLGHGEEVSNVVLATELWLVALAWILHHELTHVRLGHLEGVVQRIEDEVAADEGATDWLMEGVSERLVRDKRGLGIAIAAVTLVGFALHRDSRLASSNRTHPPAGERVFKALSHPSFPEDHPAQELALIGMKIHLDSLGIDMPPGPFDTTSECLAAYCKALADRELGRG